MLLLAVLVCTLQCSSTDDEDDAKPVVSLNKELSEEELANLPSEIFINQFISYIINGNYETNYSSYDVKLLDENDLTTMMFMGVNIYFDMLKSDDSQFYASKCTF